MQFKYISSSKHFLAYIGTEFGGSKKRSIKDNNIIVTEMEKPKNFTSRKIWKVKIGIHN